MLVKEDEANVGTAITAFDFSGSLVDVDAISNTGIATIQTVLQLKIKVQLLELQVASQHLISWVMESQLVASGETATVTVSAIPGCAC